VTWQLFKRGTKPYGNALQLRAEGCDVSRACHTSAGHSQIVRNGVLCRLSESPKSRLDPRTSLFLRNHSAI
jgi:hypothetical protein